MGGAAASWVKAAPSGDAVLIMVKAVPGSSRDAVAGVLGDRLKVRVSAAPEKGKANAAICELLAERLGVGVRLVSVVAGQARAEKTVRVEGVRIDRVVRALA